MTPGTGLHAAVFLDRDGTINVEKEYLHRIEEFAFLPGVPAALKRLQDAGYLLVVVTNQSGVARGFYDEQAVHGLHAHVQQRLDAHGVRIDGFYFCPHHPVAGVAPYRVDCDCRKGAPGMLIKAAREHGIDLPRSFMVGDKLADVEAGLAAGCRPVLVRSGYGREEEPRVTARFPGTKICEDLGAAVQYILEVCPMTKVDS